MTNFWHGLNRREQFSLIIMGACVVLFLMYLLIIMPLMENRDRAIRAFNDEKSRYTRIMELAELAGSTKQTNQENITKIPIREAATNASRNTGVAISRIQPGNDNKVTFWVDRTGTAEIMNWLILLKSENGHNPIKITLQRNSDEKSLRGQFEFNGDNS